MPLDSSNARYIGSLKAPRVAGFKWLEPQDALDEQIYRKILTEGCAILPFAGTDTSPEFTYSVGLYLNFLYPEILLMGLHPSTAHAIISRLRNDAAQGHTLSASSVRNDLFPDGRSVRFRAVPEDRYLDYLGRNCSFYYSIFELARRQFHFPVLQGIWPGHQGLFPDEEGCDPKYVAIHMLVPQP